MEGKVGKVGKKRALLAVLVGATVFGGIYGLAASLGVSSGALGAGDATVVACQSTAITVGYSPSYSGGSYSATTVSINGLDTAANKCGSKAIKVTLSGAGGASLGEQTDTTPSSGTSMNVSFSGVSAAAVEGVSVAITG